MKTSEYSFPVVGFVGLSGSGKTTLLDNIIQLLSEKQFKVAAIKHAHHTVDLDTPGKDSYRLRKSGAVPTILSTGAQWALFYENNSRDTITLEVLTQQLSLFSPDIVLVEGYKQESIPVFLVHREGFSSGQLLEKLHEPVAVIGDGSGSFKNIRQLDINDIHTVTDFIIEHFLSDKCHHEE